MTSRSSNRARGRATAAQRRKLGGLAVLVVVCAMVWGRNVWLKAPRQAGASAPVADDQWARSDESGAAGADRPRVRLVLSAEADRDPFVFDVGAYAQRAIDSEPEPEDIEREPEPADPLPELKALRLQGTFVGDEPRAMINGLTLRIGDEIRGFRLDSVGNRRVTLTKDGVRFDLEM